MYQVMSRADSPGKSSPAPAPDPKDCSFGTASLCDLGRYRKTLYAALEHQCGNAHAVSNDHEEDFPCDASCESFGSSINDSGSGNSDISKDYSPPTEGESPVTYTSSRPQAEYGDSTSPRFLCSYTKDSNLEFSSNAFDKYHKEDAVSDVDSDGGASHKSNPQPQNDFREGTSTELPSMPDTGAWNELPLAGLEQELVLLGGAPYDRDGVFQWLNEPLYLALEENPSGSFKLLRDEPIVWVIERKEGIKGGDYHHGYSQYYSRKRIDVAAATIEVAGPIRNKGYRKRYEIVLSKGKKEYYDTS